MKECLKTGGRDALYVTLGNATVCRCDVHVLVPVHNCHQQVLQQKPCVIKLWVVHIIRSVKSFALGGGTSGGLGSHGSDILCLSSDAPAGVHSCSSDSFGLVFDILDFLFILFLLCAVLVPELLSSQYAGVLTSQLSRRTITAILIIFC